MERGCCVPRSVYTLIRGVDIGILLSERRIPSACSSQRDTYRIHRWAAADYSLLVVAVLVVDFFLFIAPTLRSTSINYHLLLCQRQLVDGRFLVRSRNRNLEGAQVGANAFYFWGSAGRAQGLKEANKFSFYRWRKKARVHFKYPAKESRSILITTEVR